MYQNLQKITCKDYIKEELYNMFALDPMVKAREPKICSCCVLIELNVYTSTALVTTSYQARIFPTWTGCDEFRHFSGVTISQHGILEAAAHSKAIYSFHRKMAWTRAVERFDRFKSCAKAVSGITVFGDVMAFIFGECFQHVSSGSRAAFPCRNLGQFDNFTISAIRHFRWFCSRYAL